MKVGAFYHYLSRRQPQDLTHFLNSPFNFSLISVELFSANRHIFHFRQLFKKSRLDPLNFRRALFRFSQALFIAFTNPFSYTTTPLINSVAFYKEYKFIYPSITKMLQSKCKWECIYIYLYYKWAWCWVGEWVWLSFLSVAKVRTKFWVGMVFFKGGVWVEWSKRLKCAKVGTMEPKLRD